MQCKFEDDITICDFERIWRQIGPHHLVPIEKLSEGEKAQIEKQMGEIHEEADKVMETVNDLEERIAERIKDLLVVVPRENRRRLSSTAFQLKAGGLSVLIEKLVLQSGRQKEDVVNNKRPWLVSLVVLEIRKLGCGIHSSPTNDEPAHADIFNKDDTRSLSKKKEAEREIAKMAKWVISPFGVLEEQNDA